MNPEPASHQTSGAASRAGELSAVIRNVYVCYFLSGAVGLVYQVLWLRKLLLVFGSTVHAVSTVLTVFFGGLAIGSWLFGRLIDRRHPAAGLRWYAVLEAGIGAYAFITLPLFDMIQHVYIPVFRSSGFSPQVLVGASFACSAAILLIPTILLGGTFPVLSRFLIRTTSERGPKIASLYAVNTAGAMAGTLFVYFVGLAVLGLKTAIVFAGVLNLGIGVMCLILDRHLTVLGFHHPGEQPAAPAEPQARAEVPGTVRWLLFAFGLSGFSAMAYEVAWTRALSLVLGSSTYAFCLMLVTFLGGMALGSWLARWHLKQQPGTVKFFILAELCLGTYGLLSIPLFSTLPDWLVTLWPLAKGSFAAISWLQLTLSVFAMLVPTLIMGLLFPIVSDLVTHRLAHLGQRLGDAYAINTFGGILGSFLCGFVLIPRWGLPWAIASAAIVNVLAASVAYMRLGGARSPVLRVATGMGWLGTAAVTALFVCVPLWKRAVFASGAYLNPEAFRNMTVEQGASEAELLFYRDSLNATVSVHRLGPTIFLKVGGKTDASNGIDMGTQILSAHIPLLLHPDPDRVLVIGLGSGVTLGHAGRHPVSKLHCAELDEAVIAGARYFGDYNYDVHHDPRARIIAADGRNVLLASQEHYDVIISEPSNPWMSGVAYLFTREFYELAKQRLAPGGVMCQWLQLYNIFPEDVKLMLKTFHDAFPHMTVWSSVAGDVLLIGSQEPHATSVARLRERMADPNVAGALKVAGIDRPEVLLQLFWLGDKEVDALTQEIFWVHRDDQPSVEFNAPKALFAEGVFEVNYEGLQRYKADVTAIAPDYAPALETPEFHLAMAKLWEQREEPEKALESYETLVQLQPTSADAWSGLGNTALAVRQPLRAEAALAKASALAAGDAEIARLLGRIRWRYGLPNEARTAYEQAAAARAPDAWLAAELGDFYFSRKSFPLATEYYRSSLSQGGGAHVANLLGFARALKELKAWPEAEQVLKSAVSMFPDDAAMALLYGEILVEQQRWQEALSWFQRALALSPGNADAHYGLGQVALGLGGRDEGLRHLIRAVRANPYHVKAARLLQDARSRATIGGLEPS